MDHRRRMDVAALQRLGIVLAWFVLGCGSAAAEVHFAPVFEYDADHETLRIRALGPFLERNAVDDAALLAVRPIWSWFETPSGTTGWDVIWPLASGRTRGKETYGYVLTAIHTNNDRFTDNGRIRWWLVPIFFTGRSADGTRYVALFPLRGRVRDIAGMDDVQFILFPLWLRTQRNETVSQSILWPIFGRTVGPRVRKWRVFPLVGNARTPRRNQWFVLWPIGHWVHTERGNGRFRGSGVFVLPLGGLYRERDEKEGGRVRSVSWAVLWPFFSGTHEDGHRRLHLFWPVVQIEDRRSRSASMRKRWFWPLFGWKRRTDNRPEALRNDWFALWPLVAGGTVGEGDCRRQSSLRVLLYWQRVSSGKDAGTHVYRHLWPVFKFVREGDRSEFRFLAIWPQRRFGPVDRNYAPLWTLFSVQRQGDACDTDVLWGLLHRSTDGHGHCELRIFPFIDYERTQRSRWRISILGGLYRWERNHGGVQSRLLYFLRWSRPAGK